MLTKSSDIYGHAFPNVLGAVLEEMVIELLASNVFGFVHATSNYILLYLKNKLH